MRPGLSQQELERRKGLDHEKDLVGEEAAREPHHCRVHARNYASQPRVSEDESKRRRNSDDFADAKAGLLEQSTVRLEREQSRVREIEDPALAVIELTNQ